MTRRLPAFPRPDAAPWRSRASIAPDRPVVVLAASTGARSRKAASRPLDMLACLLVSFLLVASAGLGFSACAEPGGVMVFLATGCTTLVILHGLSAFGRLRPLVYAVAFLSVAAAVATAAVAPSFRRGSLASETRSSRVSMTSSARMRRCSPRRRATLRACRSTRRSASWWPWPYGFWSTAAW